MRKLNGFHFQHLLYFASLVLILFSKIALHTAGSKLSLIIIISALNVE
eukprot:UN18020